MHFSISGTILRDPELRIPTSIFSLTDECGQIGGMEKIPRKGFDLHILRSSNWMERSQPTIQKYMKEKDARA